MFSIQYKNLANYIMYKLDKIENSFSSEELQIIKEITIDYNKDKIEDLEILLNFPALNELNLFNFYLSDYNLRVLKTITNLKKITFNTCSFSNADYIALLNLESLDIINCEIESYKFIALLTELKSLTINNGHIDCLLLNNLQKLEYIDLANSIVDNFDKFNCGNIEELYINNTNVSSFDVLLNFKKLTKVGISREQFASHIDTMKKLHKQNVVLLNEGVFEITGDEL